MRHLKKIVIVLSFYLLLTVLFICFPLSFLSLDESLFLKINITSIIPLDYFFLFITIFGSSIFWFLIAIVFWLKGKRSMSLHLLYAFIIDTFFLVLLKFGFSRPRPPEIFSSLSYMDLDIGPSFPSGHTQRAFSGAIILSSYYSKFKLPFFILSVMVGMSRICLGIHYPLDILIGALNGILIGYSVLQWPTEKLKKKLGLIRRLILH